MASRYRQFFLQLGEKADQSLSQIKYIMEGVKWDFYREVSAQLSADYFWLDLNSGDGAEVLQLAPRAYLVVGLVSKAQIETVAGNLAETAASNSRFFVKDADALRFPDGFFDIVTARNCDFLPAEVARVLRPGGNFITQQVDVDEKANLVEAFGRGRMLNREEPLAEYYARELAKHGFTDIELDYYDADEYYRTAEDLLILLKYSAIIPKFGQPGDFETFARFVRENTTDRGIVTNTHRSLIRARCK